MTMNNPLYDLNNLELAELMLLWQCRSLLKEINAHPKHHKSSDFVHVRFWDDDSGGIFHLEYIRGSEPDYVQLMDDWSTLEQAVAVMSEYLQSLG